LVGWKRSFIVRLANFMDVYKLLNLHVKYILICHGIC